MFLGGSIIMLLSLVPVIFLLIIGIYLIKFLRVKIRLAELQIEKMDEKTN